MTKFLNQRVINYVDPMGFLGDEERIRIPTKSEHLSLEDLKDPLLKPESEKRGLGSPTEIKPF